VNPLKASVYREVFMNLVSHQNTNPRQAIERYLENKLSGTELLRSIASYSRWVVPARFSGGQPVFLEVGANGSRHFYMFSDTQAFEQTLGTLGSNVIGEHFIQLTGDAVLLSFDDSVDDLNINPNSEHPIYYKRHQFSLLRRWARVIRVERALDTVLSTNGGYDVIRDFDGYQIVMRSDQLGHNLMLAPDTRGRKLAAIFTAEDTLEAYLNEMRCDGWRDLEPLMMRGAELFDLLPKTPIDGLVFNCCGPVVAKAFTLAFVQRFHH